MGIETASLYWQLVRSSGYAREGYADPLNASAAGVAGLSRLTEVVFGVVVDVIPPLHAYRVLLEYGRGSRLCARAMQGGTGPFDVRDASLISPGTAVWVLLHTDLPHGIILASDAPTSETSSTKRPGWTSRASRGGAGVDQHQQVAGLLPDEQLPDWSADRPLDGLPGDFGAVTSTGMRLLLDPWMAQFSLDESTGLWLFYVDRLLRLNGRNLQLWSGSHTWDQLIDDAEVYSRLGHAIYPWEQFGALRPSATILRRHSGEEVQVSPGDVASREPQQANQLPFHRHLEFGGYLGQGRQRLVQLPPPGELYTPDSRAPFGVLRIDENLSGAYVVQSAHSILLTKRVNISAPRPRKSPEDPAGDTTADYRFSGLPGDGESHEVKPGLLGSNNPPQQQLAASKEQEAYLTGWALLHPFILHRKDWEITWSARVGDTPHNYSALRNRAHLPPPELIRRTIDHRLGEGEYYQSTSLFHMLPDGGILIGDGYGASIELSGGDVHIHAPKNVWLHAGQNVVQWGGKDIVLRAKESVDATAGEGDLRLHSARNMHLLSGTAGTGSVLLENRGAGNYDYSGKGAEVAAGGIHLHATSGDLAAWSRSVYVRSTVGNIDLDAAQGKGGIRERGASVQRFIGGVARDYFGADESAAVVNDFSGSGSIIGQPLIVNGGMAIHGSVVVQRGLSTLDGGLLTRDANSSGQMRADDAARLEAYMRKSLADIDTRQEDARNNHRETYRLGLYLETASGADTTIGQAHVTYRTVPQYGTTDFSLYESRWQQDSRLRGDGRNWVQAGLPEPPASGVIPAAVTDWDSTAYPYPGPDAFRENGYVEQDLNLYNPNTGDAVDPTTEAAPYPTAELADPRTVPLNDHYRIP